MSSMRVDPIGQARIAEARMRRRDHAIALAPAARHKAAPEQSPGALCRNSSGAPAPSSWSSISTPPSFTMSFFTAPDLLRCGYYFTLAEPVQDWPAMHRRAHICLVLALSVALAARAAAADTITVASKIDTEGALLGNMIAAGAARRRASPSTSRIGLGPTNIVRAAHPRRRDRHLSRIYRQRRALLPSRSRPGVEERRRGICRR